MNWYLAKLVYQIKVGQFEPCPQFEEQLRLLQADSKKAALQKARTIAEAEQFSFSNQHEQLVQWNFVNVCEILLISEWVDGAEVYSSINEVSSAESFIALVNDKSNALTQAL